MANRLLNSRKIMYAIPAILNLSHNFIQPVIRPIIFVQCRLRKKTTTICRINNSLEHMFILFIKWTVDEDGIIIIRNFHEIT